MELLAGALAQAIGARLEGDGGLALTGVAALESAGPRELSFLANPRYRESARATGAGALILPESERELTARAVLRAANPYLAWARAVALFHPLAAVAGGVSPRAVVEEGALLDPRCEVAPLAFVGAGARVGAGTRIGPGCIVGRDVTIGEHCLLHARVTLYDGVTIGHRVILHAGVVVGSDGFGFARDGRSWVKVPQIGTVVVEDDVEIGANAAVDRGALGATVIGRGTKIDNLVQVAHNVAVGPDCAIAAQAGVAGSSRIGAGAQLAGQSGVAGHLRLGRDVVVSGKAAVFKDLADGSFVSGIPARPHRQWMRREALMNRLARPDSARPDKEEA